PNVVRIDSYAIVDSITVARREEKLKQFANEFLWNDEYLRMRADFRPYDPLWVIALRVYNMPAAVELPLLPEYVGCKSWVTLEKSLPTAGATPAVSDEEFEQRRAAIMDP